MKKFKLKLSWLAIAGYALGGLAMLVDHQQRKEDAREAVEEYFEELALETAEARRTKPSH